MSKQEIVAFLGRVPLFAGMNDADRALIGEIAEVASFGPEEVLIEEGEVAPAFQILMVGTVRVTLPVSSRHTKVRRSKEVTLNTLGGGSCFGEYSLLDEMSASASVVGLTGGTILRIPHTKLRNLLAVDDRLARIIYHNMLVDLVGRLKRRESDVDRSLMV